MESPWPVVDFVKDNWDATVDKTKRMMGIGVIVKNSLGEVFATLSSSKKHITDPIIVETSATLRAAIFCLELGLQMIELKSDALQIVQALQRDGINLSLYGNLVKDACDALRHLDNWNLEGWSYKAK